MSEADLHEEFQVWLDDMHPKVDHFEAFLMPETWAGRYTRDSLAELEAYMLQRWPDVDTFRADADADFKDGATRYVGETYLKLAGGYWATPSDSASGYYATPVVYTDGDDPPPLPVFQLLNALLRRRTGNELVKVYDGLSEEIDELRAKRGPGWSPRHLAVTTGGGAPMVNQPLTATPEAAAWVDALPGRVEQLREHLGAAGTELDLSPASLSVVEQHAIIDLQPGDLAAESTNELALQYSSYIGEVLRLDAGGSWNLIPGDPDDNPYANLPFLARTDSGGRRRTSRPILVLDLLLDDGHPGILDRARKVYGGH